jgi:hypothetical protein
MSGGCGSGCGWVVCQCGCGTLIPAINKRREPARFVRGHFKKPLLVSRYAERGERRIHVLRAERALGRPLPKGAVVHHADGSTRADSPLVICQDAAYHKLLHVRMRVRAAGGDPNTQRVCSTCRQPKDFAAFYTRKTIAPGRSHQAEAARTTTCKQCVAAHKRKVAA